MVVAYLPLGVYGTTSTAIALDQMLPTFLSLRFALIVGIGGGVPTKHSLPQDPVFDPVSTQFHA